MSKEEIFTKSLEQFKYKVPLRVEDPVWSTDRDAIRWNKGGFTKSKLPSGVYRYVSPYGAAPFIQRLAVSVDNLLELPDDSSTEVLEHITDFWTKEAPFRELGFVYKRGIILYGPPGSGKSATIYRLMKRLEDEDAVMIMAQSSYDAEGAIEIIKSLEPTRKIVVIFEDIDGIISRYGDEPMTHLLDGGTDVDSVLFIATTNYPERLPERLLNRPSRFDVVIEIGMPTEEARRFYIEATVPNLLIDIDTIVKLTDGMSIAEIKEIIILVYIFDIEPKEAVRRLKDKTIMNSKSNFSKFKQTATVAIADLHEAGVDPEIIHKALDKMK